LNFYYTFRHYCCVTKVTLTEFSVVFVLLSC